MHGSHVIANKYCADKLYVLQLGPSSQVSLDYSLCAHEHFFKLKSAAMSQRREGISLQGAVHVLANVTHPICRSSTECASAGGTTV